MKKFIITEEEKKKIRLLYEDQSQFVKDINNLFKTRGIPSNSFDSLDYANYASGTTEYNEHVKNFGLIRNAFKNYQNNVLSNKTDLTRTIDYLKKYQQGNQSQQKWKNRVIKTLENLQQKITNSQENTTTTTTTSNIF